VIRGSKWLVFGRLGSALLLTAIAVISGEAFQSKETLYLAAMIAAGVAVLGWLGRGQKHLLAPLFLADIGWISLSVVGAARADAGLGLLFALVAFAAGLCLGGRLALAVSLVAGLALVATVNGVPDLRIEPSWVLIQGLLVLALGAASDHTRKHLESQEQALAVASRALEIMRLDTDTIVQNLASGVLSVDSSGSVVHVNRVAETTLGLGSHGVRGVPITEVLPTGSEAMTALLLRGLEGEPVQRAEIEVNRDGTAVPLGIGTTVLVGPDDETTGVVALFQDLTDIRRQESLARKRDRLAAVGELAAGIAHEIRNSVLPISGSVQILGQELKLEGEQSKLFEVVEREMENIERFVSALLLYTRNRELRLENVDLRTLTEEAAEDSRLTRTDGLTVQVAGDPAQVLADPDQVRQALRNLVMNAADAVSRDGRITLRTGIDADDRPWIEVEDDGPGLPKQSRSRVVQPFYTDKPGGTGLGLAIVSRIAEDHNGQLQLLDGARGGARLRIVFNPAQAESEVTSHAA
jgi:PAS domain S-box-containing protein